MPTLTTIAASGTVLVNTEYSSLLITRNISHSSHMPLYRVRNFGYGWLYPRFVFITEHKLWVQKLKLLHSKINSTMFTLPWTSFFELINNGGDPNNTKLKEVKRGETKCRKDSTCRRSEYSSRRVRIVDYILFGNIENQIAETPSMPSAFTKCVRYVYNPIYYPVVAGTTVRPIEVFCDPVDFERANFHALHYSMTIKDLSCWLNNSRKSFNKSALMEVLIIDAYSNEQIKCFPLKYFENYKLLIHSNATPESMSDL